VADKVSFFLVSRLIGKR